MKIMKDRILRSKVIVGPILALVLGATVVFTTAGGRHPEGPRLSDQLFAQRIAGSYLVDQPDGSRILLNLNLGGSTHREASFDFVGLGVPGLPFHFVGGAFGNWTRIGPRTIREVELNFGFGTDGQVSIISKVQVDIEFNHDLQSATASLVSGFYTPDQDPLTEDPASAGPSGSGLILRRIH